MTASVPDSSAAAVVPAEGRGAVYALGAAAVRVETDAVECSRWLEAYLRPSFETGGPGGTIAVVHVAATREAYEALARHAASPVERLACFALDTRVVELPAWSQGDELVLADADLSAFYRVRDRRVDVIGRPGDRRPWVGAMRVVREILTAAANSGGRVIDLHAAAFEAGQRAVLIAGQRNSGKTTLLAYGASAGARVMANDRVLVDVGREPASAQGIPTLVAVRSRTFAFFPGLRGGAATGRPTLLSPGEEEIEPGDLARGVNVQSVSVTEFADRLGASSINGAPLDAVVFPELAAGAGAWTLDLVPFAAGLTLLHACAYGGSRTGVDTVFGRLGGPGLSASASAALFAQLSRSVRFFRCRLGSHAYERPGQEWLSALGLSSGIAPAP